jgi:acetaldehyde dehydrogenase
MNRVRAAILGSGNIGTDLLIKMLRTSTLLEPAAFVGIDASSDGLRRATRLGVSTTADGLQGLLRMPELESIDIVFDATSAAAHREHDAVLGPLGKQLVDLTPAALGPFAVPAIEGAAVVAAPNVNMVTCGGQATIPVIDAVARVAPVRYAEIVSSIASKSAGLGTRANIDEFTTTTALALERVGRAQRGKAIIILNPAEPPLLMRNTVYALCERADEAAIDASVREAVQRVQRYVPGYRLKQAVQFEPWTGRFPGLKVSVFLEVEGAAHYLPAYAGNLDIMTSAALAAGEALVDARARARRAEVTA